MLRDFELVNPETGEVRKRESMSRYQAKRRNRTMAAFDNPHRWREVEEAGDEE